MCVCLEFTDIPQEFVQMLGKQWRCLVGSFAHLLLPLPLQLQIVLLPIDVKISISSNIIEPISKRYILCVIAEESQQTWHALLLAGARIQSNHSR
jgi:hypothetical protein